jgi:hypothetical protein
MNLLLAASSPYEEYIDNHLELGVRIARLVRHIRIETKLYNALSTIDNNWIWIYRPDMSNHESMLATIYAMSICNDGITLRIAPCSDIVSLHIYDTKNHLLLDYWQAAIPLDISHISTWIQDQLIPIIKNCK